MKPKKVKNLKSRCNLLSSKTITITKGVEPMFESWLEVLVFAVFITFFTGVIASIVARVDLKNVKS